MERERRGVVWQAGWDKLGKPSPVFMKYKPKEAVIVNVGVDHRPELVEATGLASVDPPPITYRLKMSEHFYSSVNDSYPHISKAQLEAIYYACQALEETFRNDNENPVKYGFYLADGTGVGKTRTLAGISHESILAGVQKVVWMTANKRLFQNIKDEILAFDKNVEILTIEDLNGDKRTVGGILLVAYSIFYNESEVSKLYEWMGETFSGCCYFDDVHLVKGAYNEVKPSKRGTGVVKLQSRYPEARIVYASATGASEVSHMLPLQRLGLWGVDTPYRLNTFESRITSKGIGAIEALVLELKSQGRFLSRHLSMDPITINQHTVEVGTRPGDNHFEILYTRVSQLIQLASRYMQKRKEEFYQRYTKTPATIKQARTYIGQHYSACQLLFGNMIMSSKVETAARLILEAKYNGNCSIVGIQHTGANMFEVFLKGHMWTNGLPYSNIESILRRILRYLGVKLGCPKTFVTGRNLPVKIGDWTDQMEHEADQLYKELWRNTDGDLADDEDEHSGEENDNEQNRIATNFEPQEPPNQEDTNFVRFPPYSIGSFLVDKLPDARNLSWSFDTVKQDITMEGLARLFHELYAFLPVNALDELIDRCAKEEVTVSDFTGRPNMYILENSDANSENETWTPVLKPDVESSKEEFQDNKTDVAVISTCSSAGISLAADRQRINSKKRIHITLEYGWGPEVLLQQLGRSHRSNEAEVPLYLIVRSNVPAEERFISIMSKRIKQLVTLTHGNMDGSSNLTDHMDDDLCSVVGARAVNEGLKFLVTDPQTERMLWYLGVPKMNVEGYARSGTYFTKDIEQQVNRVFNRILMLPLYAQRVFFEQVRNHYWVTSAALAIHPPLHDINLRELKYELTETRTYPIHGENVTFYEFKIDRCCDDNYLVRLLCESPRWQFYTKDWQGFTQTVLAMQREDGLFRVIYPFCRIEKLLTRESLHGWTSVVGGSQQYRESIRKWGYEVNRIRRHPTKCADELRAENCRRVIPGKGKCMFQWGVSTFCFITNPTSWVLHRLHEEYIDFQLVRVFYDQGSEPQSKIGILVSRQNCKIPLLEQSIRWQLSYDRPV